MSTPLSTALRPRERRLLVTAVFLPFLLFFLLKIGGFMSYVKLGAAGMAGVAVVATLLFKPRWGLWLVVFWVYAGLAFYVNAGGVITMVVLAGVLIDLLRGSRNRLVDVPYWLSTGAFLLICVTTMLWAKSWQYALYEIGMYLKMLILVYLIVQLVRTPQQLRMLMYVVFAGALGCVIAGVMNLALGIQKVGENYVHTSEYMMRFVATHENPNRLAAILCSSIPLGVFAVKQARRWLKPLVVLALFIVIAALFAANSRSSVFPLGIITIAILAREVRSRRSYLLIAVVAAVALFMAPSVWYERVIGLNAAFETTTLDWSVYMRLMALHTAWSLFLHHPFTGIGIGNFIVTAGYTMPIHIVVHNSYLEILVGTGVIGLLVFLVIMATGLHHLLAGVRATWTNAPEWMRTACFYCLLSGISVWISAGFATIFQRQLFWVPIAFGLVISNLLREDRAGSSTAS